MIEKKEPLLKKSITVGEVLSLAIALLGAGIVFYTTVQVRLSELEVRMTTSEKAYENAVKKQESYQERLEIKIDGIREDINQLKIDDSKK